MSPAHAKLQRVSPISDVAIRPAGPDDARVLGALTLRWDLSQPHAVRRDDFVGEYAAAWLAAGSNRPAWLAEQPDGNPVGYVMGALVTRLPSLRPRTRGWLHLSAVYVDPAWRRQGLGERMLRAVAAWAAEQDLDRIQLNAADEARSLYRRVGFGAAQDTLMQLTID